MTTITSLGTGSGLALESLVTKLVQAESGPLTRLQTQASSYKSTLSALGSLNSKLSSLQTAAKALVPSGTLTSLSKFASFTTTSSDTTVATASASTGAVAGSYSLTVNSLATADKYTSSAAPTVSSGDTLSFTFAGSSSKNTTITLDSTNNTLSGLRDAINKADIGVSATIVNGSSGAQLILKGTTGSDNGFTLGGTLSSSLTHTETATNASFELNGVAVSSSGNNNTTALSGVTLNLAKTGTTTLNITQDIATNLTSSLNSFVTAYNSANSLMKIQGAYNSETGAAGALQGNSTLSAVKSSLRNITYTSSVTSGSTTYRLSDIGISVASDGTMSLDTTKLNKALSSNPNLTTDLVASFGKSVSTSLDNAIGTSGSITNATTNINTRITQNTNQQEIAQTRLDAIEARYRKQFTALDTLISSMSSTSTYLSSYL